MFRVRIEPDLPVEEFEHLGLLYLRQSVDVVLLGVVEDDCQKLIRSHWDSGGAFGIDHLKGLVDDYVVDYAEMLVISWIVVLDEREYACFPYVECIAL